MAESGRERIARLLLDNGADLEAKSENGRTPLSIAAECGHEAIVRLLVEKRCGCKCEGQRPWHCAFVGRHEAVVQYARIGRARGTAVWSEWPPYSTFQV